MNHIPLEARLPKSFGFKVLAIVLATDLLLLPMFHIGGVPFKPAFLVLAMWALAILSLFAIAGINRSRVNRFGAVAVPILGIAVCGLLGQLYLAAEGNLLDPFEAFRSILIYVLMVLAFGFGQSVPWFRSRYLLWILYVSLVANFLFIFAGSHFPALVQLYYELAIADEVLGMRRPRGIFGNPNNTMLLVNIPFLFVVVCLRFGYLDFPKRHLLLAAITPAILAFLLGSRTELLISLFLGATLLSSLSRNLGAKLSASVVLLSALGAVFIVLSHFKDEFGFIYHAFSRFQTTDLLDLEHDLTQSILRPLLAWEPFKDRFAHSPIFGSGFSMLAQYPFDFSPLYYHNDWFRVLATSGMLGGLFLFYLMLRIAKKLGVLILLPFFLPGLTNTFLLVIPAVVFYFFMLGVLMERRAQETNVTARQYEPRLVLNRAFSKP